MIKAYFQLTFRILYWLFVAPFKGYMFSIHASIEQMVKIGVEALTMSSLTGFSVGLTLAMQSAKELMKLGAAEYVPDLVSLTLLRELGPVLIAVIVIGRSGSAVTAELGTMKVSEEIEALSVMGINPVRYLIIPRFIAMLIMLPVLTILGDFVAMFGAWLICWITLDMSVANYIIHSIERATNWDLYVGIIKAFVFAWLIITVACNAGLEVKGGAAGVGKATTNSVVYSLLAMLVANAILTGVFFYLL